MVSAVVVVVVSRANAERRIQCSVGKTLEVVPLSKAQPDTETKRRHKQETA